METVAAAAVRPPLVLGQWVDGYQVVGQAPVEFIHGSRTRPIDGHLITGSWSDPWWLYDRERGWAVAKRWKNKAQRVSGGGDRYAGSKFAEVAARDEIVIVPWQPSAGEVPG